MLAPDPPPDAAGRPKPERLRLAIEAFYARSTRKAHPEGYWQDGLWYPSASERRTCCEGFRPTPANRQALESHCRSQSHVAALYSVPLGELKAAVRDDRKRGSPIAQQVASSFVGPRRIETFADLRQQAREEAFENLHAALAHGLPLFERLHALRDSGSREEGMAPLLETATASAERLLATLHSARSLETIVTFGSALLETLKMILEQPKPKVRRAVPGTKAGTDNAPKRSAPG
ncbi:MAG TPA: hypothetical protein VGS22_19485 [Thermoanaerobaculia bacterium]|nr:hypothetical protein [Thermoanaerobaculia bacterium]